jgi:hypothetical protein
MKKTDKEMAIKNFIIHYTSDDEERKQMYKCVYDYLEDEEEDDDEDGEYDKTKDRNLESW